ncbi:MAG: hypothetical protein K8S16_21925 [Bacteroidales bacterium]|nr:hypothetical protein [Bacteroidales bacterium]
MRLERYELKSGEKLEVFEFVSVGIKGRIIKLVQYTPTNYKNLPNILTKQKTILRFMVKQKTAGKNLKII